MPLLSARILCAITTLVLLPFAPQAYAQSASDTALEKNAVLKRVGSVEHPPIDEMSGIVRSRWQENVWWVHNDSGDEPRIFAIDSTASVHVAPWETDGYAAGAGADSSDKPLWPGVQLGAAAHIDYEDIAAEDSTLYLGDIGNNGNARRDLGIYVIREPFYYDRRSRPLEYLPIAYPDQEKFPAEEWHFDAEALFVAGDSLFLLTKRREGQKINTLEAGTSLYRLDTEHPHKVNVLTKVDTHPSTPPPTAAAVSPSGDRLAVASYGSVWIFPRPEGGDRWLSTTPRRISLSDRRCEQLEAVTWDDPSTLRLVNEQRYVFVLPVGPGPGS